MVTIKRDYFKDEEKICNYYLENPNSTLKDISIKFNKLPYMIIKLILRKNNIKYNFNVPKNKSKYFYNKEFFKTIDTEEKAYWLGFILADGYLDNLGALGIELSIEDFNHLNKFVKSMESNLEVKVYHKNSTFGEQTNCRVAFRNDVIFFSLIDLGITLDKSNTGKIPVVPNDVLKHLIRGYFDGNGSLTIKELKIRNGYRCCNVGICGTKEILERIETISGFNWNWSKRRNNNTNNFQISIGQCEKIKSFLDYIYEDCNIYLDRKYEKYIKLYK